MSPLEIITFNLACELQMLPVSDSYTFSAPSVVTKGLRTVPHEQ